MRGLFDGCFFNWVSEVEVVRWSTTSLSLFLLALLLVFEVIMEEDVDVDAVVVADPPSLTIISG